LRKNIVNFPLDPLLFISLLPAVNKKRYSSSYKITLIFACKTLSKHNLKELSDRTTTNR
jgi:hypothetical protein